MKNKVSIVIPVFNGENTIERCLNSIQKQIYTDLEVLIIDDGSIDKTYDICTVLSNSDHRIRVFHKDNGGVSSARNYGIENASGKYIMFIDGDDVIEENYVSAFMEKKKLIDDSFIVISRLTTYSDDESLPRVEGMSILSDRILNADALPELWDSHLWNAPFNKVYLLQVVKDNRILFDTNFRMGEDWLFNNAYARALKPKGYYVLGSTAYQYYLDSEPWRHCRKDEFYAINKYQVDDFKKTLRELNIADSEIYKFDKRDVDFTISEIRRLVRDKEVELSIFDRVIGVKKLLKEEGISQRVSAHKNDFSKEDYIEFAINSSLFIYIWENVRQVLGKAKTKLYG